MRRVPNANKFWSMTDYNCCSFAFNTQTGFDYPDIGLIYDIYNDINEYDTSWTAFAEDIINNIFPYEDIELDRLGKANFIADISAEALLKQRSSIRIIKNEYELLPNEELVEFAVELWPFEWKMEAYGDPEKNLSEYYKERTNSYHEVNQADYYDLDYDFHFKVFRNGEWQHKIGGQEIAKTYSWRDTSEEAILDNFSGTTYSIYDSKVILFASEVEIQSE